MSLTTINLKVMSEDDGVCTVLSKPDHIYSGGQSAVAISASTDDETGEWATYSIEAVMYSAPVGWPKATGVGNVIVRTASITFGGKNATLPEDILRRANCNLYIGFRATSSDGAKVISSSLAYICRIEQGANPEDGGEIGKSTAEQLQDQIDALSSTAKQALAKGNAAYNEASIEAYDSVLKLVLKSANGSTKTIQLPSADSDAAGVMTKAQAIFLNSLFKVTANELDSGGYNLNFTDSSGAVTYVTVARQKDLRELRERATVTSESLSSTLEEVYG